LLTRHGSEAAPSHSADHFIGEHRTNGIIVEHEDFALLADAVDASYALLDRHRILRHVEIDQRAAELDVAAFAAGFGTQEHRNLVAERGDGGVLGAERQDRLRRGSTGPQWIYRSARTR
jgi:hypothetical protein